MNFLQKVAVLVGLGTFLGGENVSGLCGLGTFGGDILLEVWPVCGG
jgi:hypothetical protein